MSRGTAKLLMILNFVFMLVGSIAVLSITDGSEVALYAVGAVGIVIALILGRFLRCPRCGRGQRRDWLFAQYCPYCGANLDDQ